jgi:predicted acyltransferase
MAENSAQPTRIASLDQFRGYTVAAMFLVNFVGSYVASPMLLKHHNNFCSYADTIMPQFFFAVGFAFRLTMNRRVEERGPRAAYRLALSRILGLALVAILIYTPASLVGSWDELTSLGPRGVIQIAAKDWFQTLMHIAVTTLWMLPVIRSGAAIRVAFTVFSALLHLAASHFFYYDWVQTGGIDGGVLGFLAWTLPVVTGSLACDAVVAARPNHVARMLIVALAMMLSGWLLSAGTTVYNIQPGEADPLPEQEWAGDPVIPSTHRLSAHDLTWPEPPFVPPPAASVREENYWMMSQRAATLSYHLFAAGLSLAAYALFRNICDYGRAQVALFRILGANALAAYIVHGVVDNAVGSFVPRDAPGWYVAIGFLAYFAVTCWLIQWLDRRGLFIRL